MIIEHGARLLLDPLALGSAPAHPAFTHRTAAVIIYVVRRVKEHQVRFAALHQPVYGLNISGIPAQHPVPAQSPHITRTRDRAHGHCRDCVFFGTRRGFPFQMR